MTDEKQPKAETKRPRRRNAAGTKKGAKPSKSMASVVEEATTEAPSAAAPIVEAVHEDVPVSTPPIEEKPTVDVVAADVPVSACPTVVEVPAASEVSEEEIRKARELLKSNGYWLIPYGKIGSGIARFFGAGVDFVDRGFKGIGEWFSKKCEAMKSWHEARKRVASENKRLSDEDAARRAELLKSELRLAELRVEEARLRAAAAAPVQSAKDSVGQPVATSTVSTEAGQVGQPVPVESVVLSESKPATPSSTENAKCAEIVAPAESGVPKCIACGAELVPGARFCRKCGKPVAASSQLV